MTAAAALEQERNGRPEQVPPSEEEQRPIQLATDGVGALLQRDYLVVLVESDCTPEQVVHRIRSGFPRFSPEELALFTRSGDVNRPLAPGDTMRVVMTGLIPCGVRVTHLDEHSLTLRTLEGHPEAGRITLGAHYDQGGRLVCRIRSRNRLLNRRYWLSYHLMGKHAQTRTWTAFLEHVAERCGGRRLGSVLTATTPVAELPADRGTVEAPTFSTQRGCSQ